MSGILWKLGFLSIILGNHEKYKDMVFEHWDLRYSFTLSKLALSPSLWRIQGPLLLTSIRHVSNFPGNKYFINIVQDGFVSTFYFLSFWNWNHNKLQRNIKIYIHSACLSWLTLFLYHSGCLFSLIKTSTKNMSNFILVS